MITVFETLTGSRYELDTEGKRIRRVKGRHPTEPRQGADGEWRSYEGISDVRVGENVIVIWPGATSRSVVPSTITSTVTRVAVQTEEGT